MRTSKDEDEDRGMRTGLVDEVKDPVPEAAVNLAVDGGGLGEHPVNVLVEALQQVSRGEGEIHLYTSTIQVQCK